MIVLDSTIVNVALPSIQRDLHFTEANLTWVINAYLITFGGCLLLAGRVGDLIGRKRVFLCGVALFTVASAICGFAANATLLIVARFVQGIGGAISSSVIIAIVVTEFAGTREREKAVGVFSFTASAGGSIGLVAGGVLTQAINWHWIFFVNVPIGVVTFLLGAALVKESQGSGFRRGFDLAGSILLTASTMLGIYAIVGTDAHGWGSERTLGLASAALLLFAGFAASQRFGRNPILPLRLLRLRGLRAPNVIRGLLYAGLAGQFFLGALYLQHAQGYSALRTGLAYLPAATITALFSIGIAPRLVRRIGARRTLLPGLAMVILGLLLLARAPLNADYWRDVLPALVAFGVGGGLAFMPTIVLAMSAVAPAHAGLASGLVNMSQQLPSAIGVAVLGTLASHRTAELLRSGSARRAALVAGYHVGFTVAAVSVALGLVFAIITIRKPTSAEAR